MALEGVLAGQDSDVDLLRSPLHGDALQLYAAFAQLGKLVVATNLEQRLVRHWCRLNGLTRHTTLVPLSERTVTSLRAHGEVVSLYVDNDPERTAAALRNGVPTLLYARPLYARAGHRPDLVRRHQAKPWAELVAESQAQRTARATTTVVDVAYDEG